jgi:hypothetical protein
LGRLNTIPEYATFLKDGTTVQTLELQVTAMSDNEASTKVQLARKLLFQSFSRRSNSAACCRRQHDPGLARAPLDYNDII